MVMKKLRRILVAGLMGAMLSVGVFAQKNDNRPPKEQPKVVDKEKEQKPPPSNNNQGNSNKPRQSGVNSTCRSHTSRITPKPSSDAAPRT